MMKKLIPVLLATTCLLSACQTAQKTNTFDSINSMEQWHRFSAEPVRAELSTSENPQIKISLFQVTAKDGTQILSESIFESVSTADLCIQEEYLRAGDYDIYFSPTVHAFVDEEATFSVSKHIGGEINRETNTIDTELVDLFEVKVDSVRLEMNEFEISDITVKEVVNGTTINDMKIAERIKPGIYRIHLPGKKVSEDRMTENKILYVRADAI